MVELPVDLGKEGFDRGGTGDIGLKRDSPSASADDFANNFVCARRAGGIDGNDRSPTSAIFPSSTPICRA